MDHEELVRRVTKLEEVQTDMGHLVVAQDARIRELSTLFRSLLVPKDSHYGKLMNTLDTEWKANSKAYQERKKQTGTTELLGSKHLLLGQTLMAELYRDGDFKPQLKEVLKKRWEGLNHDTPDFLAPDIRIVKWRLTKDGKHGVLEFKLTEALTEAEEEMVRVLVLRGCKLNSGPAARAHMVRKLEGHLEGTWKK